jgi:hypothetical protein
MSSSTSSLLLQNTTFYLYIIIIYYYEILLIKIYKQEYKINLNRESAFKNEFILNMFPESNHF